ncbi:MAG: dTDP-4-dehydrorhamnose reductase [Massilioclostridium sp.]|nr:MAG: dTDP-4-dehydrorhamnose reductase [Massilioclostridium sp.]
MNIVITGCHGQLGTELQKVLKTGMSELGPISEVYKNATVVAVDIEDLDIGDFDAVSAFMEQHKPDVVFNCAAMTNVDGCETNQEVAMKANAIGPRNLAVMCKKLDAKLVHVSTDYVFAGDGNRPYVEWDITNPQSVYGASKNLGEQYVREFCDKYFIARTSWLYGYVGKNFIKTMLRLGRTNGAVTVVDDQRGNPTNAADLAYHLLQLAVTNEYGVYHCTCNGECSWYEFACKIMEVFHVDAKVSPCTSEEFPSPTKRPAYSSLDNMMLRCTIGDHMRSWEEALESYAKNYKEEG